MAPTPRSPLRAAALFVLLVGVAFLAGAGGTEVLSKSRLERCERDSDAGGALSCKQKLVLNLAVPAGSSGGEASLVTKVVDAENGTEAATRSIQDPPVITIEKTAVSAVYAINYLMDVAYRPEERVVETRKCEPDAGANVVGGCERLWNGNGAVIEHTEPVCCPCGPYQRAPSSCGNFFDKMVKGKRNTAHCLRFQDDWFHVWEIDQRRSSLGFSIKVQVKKRSSVSEVVVTPENKTVVSSDNFLRVNLIGEFGGYDHIPAFENMYLVTPRKGAGSGQPQDLGDEKSRWMLLERIRFGPECNKIGVGYEAFQNQPSFCYAPLSSCVNDQLWNYLESDKNRVNRNQVPQYVVEGRFQRINQHPNAGVHSFSVGVTEALSSNLLLELHADDIEYFYQRSPGKIISIDVPPFEALSQIGNATVTTKNIGKLESSYTLTFKCLTGISNMEEQYYIMKPGEVTIRSFDLRSSTDRAETYQCTAILKASDFTEVDRGQCQFSTTATVFNNGSQIGSTNDLKETGIWEAIKAFCVNFWDFVINFLTGRSCSWTKCSSLLDFACHFQYICIGWVIIICLLLTMVPTGAVTLWLLHQKGFFDPLCDWWEDLWGLDTHDYRDHHHRRHKKGHHHHHHHHRHSHHHHALKSEHGHHHVLHRHREQQPEAAAEDEGHHWRHGHDTALGVQHRGVAEHKYRHGKAVAQYFDGPSLPRGAEEALEFRERRPDEVRHAQHGLHDGERRHSRAPGYERF
ncbi:hypothetical protein HU200_061227 [Digitaria exilis]|uniref:Generative cell specific-1/HAP2 domain-containing protein n=1 Tax=Digitaria exilis TaxID=1010633 RepID=A0A835A801_9POAL|nr:hypothetical protein HU200_061227 [Digitaria exilis]